MISDPEALVQGSWEATGRQDTIAVTHAESLGMSLYHLLTGPRSSLYYDSGFGATLVNLNTRYHSSIEVVKQNLRPPVLTSSRHRCRWGVLETRGSGPNAEARDRRRYGPAGSPQLSFGLVMVSVDAPINLTAVDSCESAFQHRLGLPSCRLYADSGFPYNG